MSIDYIKLGKRIQHFRNKRKLSQIALAEDAGISRQYLSHLELGDKVASLDTVIAIANALRVSCDDILKDSITFENDSQQFEDLLLDCSKSESDILIRNMEQLKKILKQHQIK